MTRVAFHLSRPSDAHIYHRLQTAIAKSNRELLRSFKGA